MLMANFVRARARVSAMSTAQLLLCPTYHLFARSQSTGTQISLNVESLLVPTLSGNYDMVEVKRRHDLMLTVFDDDTVAPLGLWMEVFYRRHHIELLPAALIEALRTGGALTGRQSLAGASFFAEIFRRMCSDVPSAVRAMDCFAAALKAERLDGPQGRSASVEQQAQAFDLLDTLLRGLWLADLPHLDTYLSTTAEGWKATLKGQMHEAQEEAIGGEEDAWGAEDDAAVVESLFPPEGERNRTHILRWPIPSLTLTTFESHIKQSPFPLYGATRYWFTHTHALRKIALGGNSTKAARMQLLSPVLAQQLTLAMVDAYWASFYASGDAMGTVCRVMDVATPYSEFMEEYGDKWVTNYDEMREPPEELADSPVALMRFESSRYALWTLLSHTRKHTSVGEAFLDHLGSVNDKALLQDPFGTEGALTTFGRSRFDLMRALQPSLTELAIAATQDGIGSGRYPPAYALLWGDKGEQASAGNVKLIEPAAQHAAGMEATSSTSVSIGDGDGGAAQGFVASVPLLGNQGRDRKKGTMALRSTRIKGTGE